MPDPAAGMGPWRRIGHCSAWKAMRRGGPDGFTCRTLRLGETGGNPAAAIGGRGVSAGGPGIARQQKTPFFPLAPRGKRMYEGSVRTGRCAASGAPGRGCRSRPHALPEERPAIREIEGSPEGGATLAGRWKFTNIFLHEKKTPDSDLHQSHDFSAACIIKN